MKFTSVLGKPDCQRVKNVMQIIEAQSFDVISCGVYIGNLKLEFPGIGLEWEKVLFEFEID